MNKILTSSDLIRVRQALLEWGKPKDVAARYDDNFLNKQIAVWEKFVQMEWSSADEEKYAQDVRVRYWLQLVMENVSEETAKKLTECIRPFDDLFKEDMIERTDKNYVSNAVLKHYPYFWETHTLVTNQDE